MRAQDIARVRKLAAEVTDLCAAVEREARSNDTLFYSGSRTTAELRRRSMDLTRALADMRRP